MLLRITLHLARNPAHPDGSARHGYEMVAPLDAHGHLAAEEWLKQRELCRVKRFWGNEPERWGWLVHRPGGVGGATWAFDYDEATRSDDEPGYRLGDHRFVLDEYVSIRHDGRTEPFKVVAIEPRRPSTGEAGPA